MSLPGSIELYLKKKSSMLLTFTLLTLFPLNLFPQENNQPAKETAVENTGGGGTSGEGSRQSKKYNLKTKGFSQLVEIDEDGDPINKGKRYAIVVGINEYNDRAISALSKARNDAKAVGKVLKEIGQFDQVFVMTDDIDVREDHHHLYPTKLKIEEKLESILRFATPDDLIVFFFSGHGISDYDENGYLLTVDTVSEKEKKFETSLRVDWIVNRLKATKIKKSLLILDACREVLDSKKSLERDSIKEKIYDQAEVAATFYSTKAGFYSYEDDESDYGVFTKHLIYGMEGRADENNDGVVSFSELEVYVNKGVKDWSIKNNKQQKPFTKIYGEKTGDLAITVASNPAKSLADIKVSVEIPPLFFRSALIPGWGQWHNDKTIKGTGIFLAFAGVTGFLVSSYNNYKSAEKNYISASQSVLFYPSDPTLVTLGYLNANSLHSNYQSQANLAKSVSAGLIAVYAINLIDVLLFSEKSSTAILDKKTEGLNLNASTQPYATNSSYSLERVITATYTWRF